MSNWRIDKTALAALLRYRDDLRGTMSVELVLVLPILFWGYVAMMVFYDAYRARMEAQAAALHVADLVSRQPNEIRTSYLEGLNDVYDFLTSRNRNTRLRISSVMWVPDSDDPQIAWSYGTRGLPSLLDLSVSQINTPGDGEDDGSAPTPTGFDVFDNQLPVADLADRIPQVLPGEALILVEAFTLWRSPIVSWMGFDFLNDVRFTPLAVTRPRFSPFIRFEGDNDVYPESPPDTMPIVGEPPPPVEDEEDPEPENTTVTIVNTDFNDQNTAGWSQDRITQTHTSSFLGPFGNETLNTPVTYQVNLGERSSSAVIEFDLFIIDSWDGYDPQWAKPSGEMFLITVNGSAISATPFQLSPWGLFERERRHVVSRAEGRFTTTMTLLQSHTNIWGAGWDDQVWRVRIEVENPATQFTLGFIGDLDEGIENESFGFNRFKVEAERGEHSSPLHFISTDPILGNDPYTRFAVHGGCPDSRLGTKTHSLRVDDLWGGLTFRVRARGQQQLRYCGLGVPNNSNYVGHASPTFQLNWDNQGYNWQGSYLRVRTNHGGNNCNSTLLIRTPAGQWHFNDDFSGINAGRELGPAQSGTYHIWVGSYGVGACDVNLAFELY